MVELQENVIYFDVGLKTCQWDIGICLKPHFYKECQLFRNPKTDFFLTSANKPQSSLVSYLQVWSQLWP